MKKFLSTLSILLAIFAVQTFPVSADDSHHKVEAQKTYAGKGEVVVLDKSASKVKLKHEAIAELDWPAMTMFFPVDDKAKIETLKDGDKVEFKFTKSTSGPVITEIKPAK